MLRVEHVQRVRARAGEREGDAEAVEREAVPETDDEDEADGRQPERGPEPRPHLLLSDEVRPERHEQRPEEDQHERDTDLQPPDREQVEELREHDSARAEDGQVGELAPRRPQLVRAGHCDDDDEDRERQHAAELGEAIGGKLGIERYLDHGRR